MNSNSLQVKNVIGWIQMVLNNHKRHLQNLALNPFAGLPELTNQNGQECYGSCATQAWSTSVMVELFYDLKDKANNLENQNKNCFP